MFIKNTQLIGYLSKTKKEKEKGSKYCVVGSTQLVGNWMIGITK